jgi:tetratricopeptide (TPR) repeat protein
MSHDECGDRNDYCKTGYFKYCLQDYRGALQDYSSAIDLNPICPAAYNNRGLIHLFLRQTIEALADFRKAKELGFPVDMKNLNLEN